MASFDINPKTHKAANKQAKINNMKKSDNPNERKVAAKKLTPAARVDVPKFKKGQQEEVVPGLSLVDIILGEEKCGKGMYYCYTDKKCKKIPEGLKMTARFGGGGHEPQEVGIDKPVEGGDGNGGNGGGTTESVSIEDAFGNKFMEVVDLIKPEDITEKCWKGYKKKGMKTMFGKRYPNCVKANEENESVDEGIRGDDSPTNAQITKQGAERQNAVAKLMQNKEMQKRFDAAIDKKIKKEKEEQAKRMRGEEVEVDEANKLEKHLGMGSNTPENELSRMKRRASASGIGSKGPDGKPKQNTNPGTIRMNRGVARMVHKRNRGKSPSDPTYKKRQGIDPHADTKSYRDSPLGLSLIHI